MSTSTGSSSSAAAKAQVLRRQRARRLLRRFVIWVWVPTLAAVVYYGFWAAPQYESVTVFAINTPAPADGGAPAAAPRWSADDGAVVRELILSRGMVARLGAEQGLLAHYQSDVPDRFSRLAAGAGSEESFEYYLDKVEVISGKGGLLTLRVRAFGPEQAHAFSQAIVEAAETMLDEVVGRARGTSLAHEGKTRQLVVVSGPSRPDEAAYPRRLWSIATVFFVSLALMGVVGLLGGAVREHAKF